MSRTLYRCLPSLRLDRLHWKLSRPRLIPAFKLLSNYTVHGDCTFYYDSAHQMYCSNHRGQAFINYYDDGVIPSTPAGLTSSCAINRYHIEPSTSIASITQASALEPQTHLPINAERSRKEWYSPRRALCRPGIIHLLFKRQRRSSKRCHKTPGSKAINIAEVSAAIA